MTQTFTAHVKQWTDRQARNMDLIAKDAIQTTFNAMTEVQPSVKDTGGGYEVGKVPVDTGYLVGTSICSLNGNVTATGHVAGHESSPPDFAMGIAGLTLGDAVVGAFTAPYARYVEYGTAKMGGRFFVRQAAQGWQANVSAAARKFK